MPATGTVVTRADAVAVGLHTVQDNIFALLDAVGHRDPRRPGAKPIKCWMPATSRMPSPPERL